MNAERYDYTTDNDKLLYAFFSTGKRGIIAKVVIYEKTAPNHYNLGFGDYDHTTDNVSDKSVSNNGDTIKVLATVIQTMRDFFEARPHALLDIQGSTPTRTKLYQKIIRNNWEYIETNFKILAFKDINGEPEIPDFSIEYALFQISKR
ncbi:MAG: hypothetical protein EAZ95_11810 [Bacteroidetes bacterium]|nr:MAG: hypothetical protein EAZ95_11810 [Bacteroidota bacterium]